MNDARHIKSLGTILGVWAHPDDEVFSCGGIMALAAENGQRVMCMTASRGEAGVQDESRWPAEKLGAIRTKELEAAYECLGAIEHVWFDYSDGKVGDVSLAEGEKVVTRRIEACHPDTILTFGPEGMTGHPDHRAVSAWATRVGKERGIAVYHAVLTPETYDADREADEQFDIFFNIERPPIVQRGDCDLYIDLSDKTLQKKCAALKAMPSQTESLIKAMGEEKVCDMNRIESFVRAK
ncbi:MAG: PIG-L family deacetylase [Candidatus Saccharibacteria bacterium]|nr:PIG-L family deacetylase [Candidatus Saccharibacteria bacterium]